MSDFESRFIVSGSYSQDEIVVRSEFQDFTGRRFEMARDVVVLKERLIRDALIALGWTPPPEQAANAEQEQSA